jgi:hypothetical protein
MYVGGGATAATTAAAAAAAKRRIEQEEEEMTNYNREDLEGWEFKIIRANSRKFKTAEAVRRLCAEEARAGWEMMEKFSDSRIRFKRRVEKRADDAHLDIDPYRTHIGISETGIVLVVLSVLAAVALAGVLVATLLGFRP